ncbi:hypothetical protein L6452_10118 [Arctium lappa]|uniref:Uncharacterized protein n=1 Tax=Arctium lappa TaxID=4217 RepID=A0ACB9DLS8_ARCLA|nr:hypothetical protein L6452_10118 [Arctium lappa]
MAKINNPHLPPNPTKIYTHFLYKAIFLCIFLLLLPLFPSESLHFINLTINTTSWDLLQLLFEGIAVSYDLFSKRNNDEKQETDNNAHSYVNKLLQVSSVFMMILKPTSVFDDDFVGQIWAE